MNCSAWYSRFISSLLSYTMLSSCPSVVPLTTIGVRAVGELDELFDEVRGLALHEHGLRVAARAEHPRHAERVFRRHRRRQVVGELHVQRRKRARHDAAVVVDVEARREGAPFAGRPVVHQRVTIGVADVRVARELHGAVLARVLRERGLQHRIAVAVQVVARAEARHEAREAGRLLIPPVASLAACSKRMPRFSVSCGETIQRSCTYAEVVVWLNSAPRWGIQRCTRAMPGTNSGIGWPSASSTGAPPDIDGSRPGTRSPSSSVRSRPRAVDEVLDAALQLMAAEAAARGEVADARRQLTVVALFGVARVEVRRVVLILRAGARQERRIEDVGRRPADALGRESLLRVLRRQQHALRAARRCS